MKKIVTIFLIFLLGLSFSQTNDDLRTGANKKKTSKSNGSSNPSSNRGISTQEAQLIISSFDLLYNLGLLSTGIFAKGIKANSEMIRERRDSLPRITNLEVNLGYGFFPDDFASYTPKLRLQGGVFGTSARGFIRQDRSNAFVKDFFTTISWQILEINYLNLDYLTIRSGIGFVYNKAGEGGFTSNEIATSADVFLAHDFIRINVEGRITPFGDVKFRKEANARVYIRPANYKKLKIEIFGGGYYSQYFDEFNLWSLEAGVGFMLY